MRNIYNVQFLPFLKSKRFKDFGIYGLGQFINILSPLLITPYIIYTCGIENLGIIATGQAFAYILIVIVDYSSYILGVKEVSVNRNDVLRLEQIYYSNYISKIILFLFVFLISLLLIYFVPFFNNNWLAMLFSISIILGQAINPTWFLQGIENFKWISLINIFSKIIFFIGVFSMVKSESDFIYVNLFLGLGAIFMSLISFYKIKRNYHFSSFWTHKDTAIKLLINDFSFCLSQLFFSIRNYSPVMIISFFAGNYIAGQFKIIEQIIGLFRTYLQMFFKFSYSFICLEIVKNLKKGIQIWIKTNGLNMGLLLIMLFFTFLFSNEVLTFFNVGEDNFTELQNYLNIALIIPILIALTLAMEQVLFSLNKNKIYIRITIFSSIFNLVSISFLISYFSLTEVFWLLIFTESMLFSVYFFILRPIVLNFGK